MLKSAEQFDAAIIGGGVIGCSIAWRLAQAGMRVAVIER
ncbi:MAG TPA: FAD-dependent oxidoreductase, partial [Blastocatellia bacterium]